MEEPYERPYLEEEKKERKPTEEKPVSLTLWQKYKNLLIGLTLLAFIFYGLNIVHINYVIIMAVITIVVYLYSQAQERGFFGAVKYQLPDLLDEAEKIANLLLTYYGWRLVLERIEPFGKHTSRAHEPLVVYYLFRKYNKKTQVYDRWVVVAQSVLDKDKKNCGIISIDEYAFRPVETPARTWSGVKTGEYLLPTTPTITRIIERPVIRAPAEGEEEFGEIE